MADNNDRPGGADNNAPPEQKLQEMLENKWDPGKLSKFMRGSSSKSTRLDMSQRSRFEKRLGVDLGDVRIFSGELAEEITRAHGAEALTVGDTGIILMRQSTTHAPGTAAGTALLAHELTHVAQARPSAISFKKTQRDLAQEDESEEEAEDHEAEVMAEEQGGAPPPGQDVAKKGENEAERREKIIDRVMELFDRDAHLWTLRLGDLQRRG